MGMSEGRSGVGLGKVHKRWLFGLVSALALVAIFGFAPKVRTKPTYPPNAELDEFVKVPDPVKVKVRGGERIEAAEFKGRLAAVYDCRKGRGMTAEGELLSKAQVDEFITVHSRSPNAGILLEFETEAHPYQEFSLHFGSGVKERDFEIGVPADIGAKRLILRSQYEFDGSGKEIRIHIAPRVGRYARASIDIELPGWPGK